LGLRDRVELGVDDGACVEVRQRLAQRLGAQCTCAAHAGLEHLARHLAGAEARHAHLLRQRAHDVAQRSIELGLVDLHAQADEVPLHWLGGRTHHEPTTLPVAARRRRRAGGPLVVHTMTFMARSTARPTALSPPTSTPPASSTSSAVARPHPRRTKSRLERPSVTVGTTSSATGRARPPSTAIVKARPSSPGPDTSKRTAVPSAQAARLPTTKG